MIMDTISFMFLSACYMIIVTTIFSTLFANVDPEEYGEMSLAFQTLFSAMTG